MNRKKAFTFFALLSLCLLLFGGARAESAPDVSAWVADWALQDGLKEAEFCKGRLSSVQIFAAYFDGNDRPFLGKELKSWLPTASRWAERAGNPELYLTVVNDLILGRNKIVHKDPDLISRLLGDEGSRKSHMNRLIELAANDALAGLELDYERIRPQDWESYLSFCEDLARGLSFMGKKLRVVLEPKKEYYNSPLPGGVEFVIMAYNLHGGHNDPGPKADGAFISLLAQRCRQATGIMPRIAFATGGFLWGADGKVKSLTERDALALAKKQGRIALVDHETGALSFTYLSRGPKKVDEVWFADGNTLAGWQSAAAAEGFSSFALWRLGGNERQSVERAAHHLPEKRGRTLYVAQDGPTGSGLSAENPISSLSRALSLARPGDRILVAPGIYRESLRTATPNIRVEARDVKPGEAPTVEVISTSGAVLKDRSNTLWRGVKFSAAEGAERLLELESFSGRFEYCHFAGLSREKNAQKLLEASDSRGSFHGCTFAGLEQAQLALNLRSSLPRGLTFSYCLFSDFGSVCELSGAQNVNFVNCLFARNKCVLERFPDSSGAAAFRNSIFFQNDGESLFIADESQPKVELTCCVLAPPLNRWGNTFFRTMEFEPAGAVKTEGCFVASPEFVSGRHKALVNLGIDDTQNLELWCAIADEASRYNFPVTLAVNTAKMTPELWQTLKDRVAQGHEAASHSSSHVPVNTSDALKISYYRPGLQSATLTTNGEKLTVSADGKTVFEFVTAGEGPHPSMGELVAALKQSGVDAVLASPEVRDVPCRLLREQKKLDILFSNFMITVQLDPEKFITFEMVESKTVLERELGGKAGVFVFPYSTVSDRALKKAAETGFTVARTGGEAACSPFTSGFCAREIWGYGMSRVLDNPAPPPESMRNAALLLMDFFKDRGVAGALYSHGAGEMSLEAWKTLLAALSEDENLSIVTLSAMADAMAQRAREFGVSPDARGSVVLPPGPDLTDYHLKPTSRLRGAGTPMGIAEDFEGTALKHGEKPSIGLYR